MRLFKQLFWFCIITTAPLAAWAGGFYLPEIATPGSIGTAGAVNPTNIIDSSSAITNPAGMVHLTEENARMLDSQLMVPYVTFDSDIAAAGGSDGGNAGDAAMVPGISFAHKIDEKQSVGISWGKRRNENTYLGASAEYIWLGQNKIDQLTGSTGARV